MNSKEMEAAKKEGRIVIAIAMGICVPFLVCVVLYVVVASVAQAAIQLQEWVLSN